MVDEAVRLQRRADPVAFFVLERDRLRPPDGRRNRLPRLARDLDLLEKLLLRELLEQRRLAAPEDVDLGPALPLDDAAVRDRRAGRDRVDLHHDVPLLLGVLGEGLQRRVVDELRDRRDEVQLALDRRLGGSHARREQRHRRHRQRQRSSHHGALLLRRCPEPTQLWAHSRDRSTARFQFA